MNRETLEGLVAELERIYGIRILLLSECSSRAWGLSTSSSDFDLAFVYHQLPWAKRLEDTSNNIHYKKFEGFDFRGYDVRRAFALACNSNLGMYEMIHSPIRYAQDISGSLMKDTVEKYYAPGVLFDSLQGHTKKILLKQMEQDIKAFTSKDFQYMLRFACMALQVYTGVKLKTDMASIRPDRFTLEEYGTLCNLRNITADEFAEFKRSELFQKVTIFATYVIGLKMQNRPPRAIDEEFYIIANENHTVLQQWCAGDHINLEYNEGAFQ